MDRNRRIVPETARYCFLDFDIDEARGRLAATAAFVDATDTRYGFSSKDLRRLGGSELCRIPELLATDHEWSGRRHGAERIRLRPPRHGGRVVMRLDWAAAPLACENFATLCDNGSTAAGGRPPVGASGKPLTYRGTPVHRVVPGFVAQGGDLVMGNGSGGESIFGGKKFKDERAGLQMRHDRRGLLAMGNSGKNSNSSQWYITLAPAPQCDGKHVVFGRVVSGWDTLDALESHGQASGEPTVVITISDCGLWEPLQTPGDGFWFDKPDQEMYSGISPVFCVRPRLAVIVPNESVLSKFQKSLASFCALVPLTLEESDDSVSKMATQVVKMLTDHVVDAVLIAPTCKVITSTIKLSWERIPVEKVVIEVKPVDAATVVTMQSWLADMPGWYIWQ